MALSNWDTSASTHDGKVSDGTFRYGYGDGIGSVHSRKRRRRHT